LATKAGIPLLEMSWKPKDVVMCGSRFGSKLRSNLKHFMNQTVFPRNPIKPKANRAATILENTLGSRALGIDCLFVCQPTRGRRIHPYRPKLQNAKSYVVSKRL